MHQTALNTVHNVIYMYYSIYLGIGERLFKTDLRLGLYFKLKLET